MADNVVIRKYSKLTLLNYVIGDDCFIQNVDVILVEGKTTFGNGVEVNVLNETGGREVHITDKLSAHFAYIYSLYRHRPQLIERMKSIIDFYSEKHASDMGEIGYGSMIVNVGYIKNVRMGAYTKITGAMKLKNGVSTATKLRRFISAATLLRKISSFLQNQNRRRHQYFEMFCGSSLSSRSWIFGIRFIVFQ